MARGPRPQFRDLYDAGGPWPWGACTREARDRATGTARTVRAVPKSQAQDAQALRQEVAVMRALDHPNVVQLVDIFEDRLHLLLITERCEGRLPEDLGGRPSEPQAALLVRQLLLAVRHMHERHLCHRNLQLASLLLKGRGPVGADSVLKVAGFELACPFEPGKALRLVCGPAGYTAPEVLDEAYGSPADLWSAGVLAFYLLCGYLPFRGSSEEELRREAYRGAFFFHPREWAGVSAPAKDMVRALLRPRPQQRPTAPQALRHRWISGLGEDALRALKAQPAAEPGPGPETLELDSEPSVDRDTCAPIRVHPSLRPTLLREAAMPLRQPLALTWRGARDFEPWGELTVHL